MCRSELRDLDMAAARSLGEKRTETTRLVTAVADVRALHKELKEKYDPMAPYLGDFIEREEVRARECVL